MTGFFDPISVSTRAYLVIVGLAVTALVMEQLVVLVSETMLADLHDKQKRLQEIFWLKTKKVRKDDMHTSVPGIAADVAAEETEERV